MAGAGTFAGAFVGAFAGALTGVEGEAGAPVAAPAACARSVAATSSVARGPAMPAPAKARQGTPGLQLRAHPEWRIGFNAELAARLQLVPAELQVFDAVVAASFGAQQQLAASSRTGASLSMCNSPPAPAAAPTQWAAGKLPGSFSGPPPTRAR